MINTSSESLKARKVFISQLSFLGAVEIACSVVLNMNNSLITSGPICDMSESLQGFLGI